MVRRDERGFSVVDLTCAFAVLMVLGLGLSASGHGHAHSVSRAFRETVALRAAQGEIERLRALASRGAVAAGEAEVALDDEARAQLPQARGRRHLRQVEPGLLEATVEVQWTPPGAAQPVSVDLVTLLAVEVTR